MAADLHIHVVEGITEDDLADFFTNTLGSKYFNLERGRRVQERERELEKQYRRPDGRIGDKWDEYWNQTVSGKINNTPNIWVGEVSWLKAALFEDEETFIPAPVEVIHEAIGGDLPVLDEELKAKILGAFGEKNSTGYSVSGADEIEEFLNQHMGKRLFTVSW